MNPERRASKGDPAKAALPHPQLFGAGPRFSRFGRAPRLVNDPTEAHRAVFSECGLIYGRSFGSKSAYAHTHPARFYVANASVFTGDGACVWRGDLDVAATSDRDGLINASRRLRKKFYISREFSWPENQQVPRTWLATVAVATVWRGSIEAAGDTKRLHGSLEQAIAAASDHHGRKKPPRSFPRKAAGPGEKRTGIAP